MKTTTCPLCMGTGLTGKSQCNMCKGRGAIRQILPFQVFARSTWRKLIWGVFWIIEAQIETYLAGIFIPRYFWEILGPVNISLFLSITVATIYGALSIVASAISFRRWFGIKYQEW
jgi:Mg/Co/Ni transporter MgtE